MNQKLLENNYLVVPKFLSKSLAKKIANEYIGFVKEKNILGDEQAPKSPSQYNYIRFLELLCEKTSQVSKILGEKVLPTYAYGRVYKKGEELKRHRDRDACEISLTINLSNGASWPIFFQKPDGAEVSVILNPGDAAMYLGCSSDHWREPYQDNKDLVQVFLHYVRSNGSRAEWVFDQKRKPSPPSTPSELSKYIIYIENAVPHELCDAIIREYSNSDDWQQSTVGADAVERPEVRGAKAIGISLPVIIEKNKEVRLDLDKRLFECTSLAIKNYSELFPECSVKQDSGYDLLKYTEGMGYSRHTDDFSENPRTVSCSFCLSDEYEGAEFNFPDHNVSFKQAKGSALLFPSNFMYPHEVTKVISGIRYAIVTWFR
jgi:hypothetical protein